MRLLTMKTNYMEGANPHASAIRLMNRRQDGFIIRLQLPAEAFRASITPAKKGGDHPHVNVQVDLTYYTYARPEMNGELLRTLEIPPGETRGCYVEGTFKPTELEKNEDPPLPRRCVVSAPVDVLPVETATGAAREMALLTRDRALDRVHKNLLGHLEDEQVSMRVNVVDIPQDEGQARPLAYANSSVDTPARVEIREKVQVFDVFACVTGMKVLFHDGTSGIRVPVGDLDYFAPRYLTAGAIDTYRDALWAVIRVIAAVPDQDGRSLTILQEHAGKVHIPPTPYLQLLQQEGYKAGPAEKSLVEYGNELVGVLVRHWEYRVQSPTYTMKNCGHVLVNEVKFTHKWVVKLFPEDYYPPDALDPTIDQAVNDAILACMDLMARGLGTSVDDILNTSGQQGLLAQDARARELLEEFWRARNYFWENFAPIPPAPPPLRVVVALVYRHGELSGVINLEAAPAANPDALLQVQPLPPAGMNIDLDTWPEIVLLINERLRAREFLPLYSGQGEQGAPTSVERQCEACHGTIIVDTDAHALVGRHWLCDRCCKEQERLKELRDKLSHQFQDVITKAGETNHWITLGVDIMRLRSKGDEAAAKASEQELNDLYKQLGISELDRQIKELGAKIFSPFD